MLPPKSAISRLPILSKARSAGRSPGSITAKILCPPSQMNLKISPPRASLPDTNKFCAHAVEQIRNAAPTHAILLNNFLRPRGSHLNLFSVTFVLMVILCDVCWFVCPFTEVLQEIRRDITRKVWWAPAIEAAVLPAISVTLRPTFRRLG